MSVDRCCCDACHIKTGTWIAAIAQFVLGAGDLINGIDYLMRSKKASVRARYVLGGQNLLTAIWLLMIVLLLVGLHKNKPFLILPHIILTMIYVILFVGSSTWLVMTGLPILSAILVLCTVTIICGLLWIEWRCYIYISTIA